MKKSLLAVLFILLSASKSFAHNVTEAEAYTLAEAGLFETILLNITHLLTSPFHIIVLTIVAAGTVLIIRAKRAGTKTSAVKAHGNRNNSNK